LSHPVIIEAEDKIYIKVKLYNDNFDHWISLNIIACR
jgi:hypothetical protein